LSEKLETPSTDEASNEMERTGLRRLLVRGGALRSALLPILAVFTALLIGGVIMAVSSPDVIAAWRQVSQNPRGALSITWGTIRDAYMALFEGSFGNPARIIRAIDTMRETGESRELLEALRPFSESLVIATPYIFAGLAVALGFRGGLFNIGAEGQLFVGGLASVYIGYSISGTLASSLRWPRQPWCIGSCGRQLVASKSAWWGQIPGQPATLGCTSSQRPC